MSEKKAEKKVEASEELTHTDAKKLVKESEMHKRNETVAGIHVGKLPKFQKG